MGRALRRVGSSARLGENSLYSSTIADMMSPSIGGRHAMGHIAGTSHAQQTLFPEALDDPIREENPVRFIDAFVDSLGLHALGFRCTQPAATGRPSSSPGDLL